MDSVLTFAEFFILYFFLLQALPRFRIPLLQKLCQVHKTALRIHIEPIHFKYCHLGVRSMIAICS